MGNTDILTTPYRNALVLCERKRGFYRTIFKHGVSKITLGERYSLGIIFHNYAG